MCIKMQVDLINGMFGIGWWLYYSYTSTGNDIQSIVCVGPSGSKNIAMITTNLCYIVHTSRRGGPGGWMERVPVDAT